MIVCSCNVLTDHDVRSAVTATDEVARSAKQVYGCLGCSAECGRCARTIKKIIHDAVTKLNVRTRSQAVAYATREGLI